MLGLGSLPDQVEGSGPVVKVLNPFFSVNNDPGI